MSAFFYNVFDKIHLKVIQFKYYKKFSERYNYLKALHTKRYKLYFSSDKETIEIYSQELQRCGKNLLDVGNSYLDIGVFNEKQTNQIREIINKTENLMQSEYVKN